MPDVVVTVPKALWAAWLSEGNAAGESWNGIDSHFLVSRLPPIAPGERVYVVAHGRLRGYAPLLRTEHPCRLFQRASCLVRGGEATAVTIPEHIRGFQGWRYRWWNRSIEEPFPDWRIP